MKLSLPSKQETATAGTKKNKKTVKPGTAVVPATPEPLPALPDWAPKTDDPEAWVRFITQYGRFQVVDALFTRAVIRTGRALIVAKSAVAHGNWHRMFADCKNHRLPEHFPFSQDKAQRMMNIAQNRVLSNPAYERLLPPSIRTMDELGRVPEDVLEQAITNKKVTPQLEYQEAKRLKPTTKPKPPRKVSDADLLIELSDELKLVLDITQDLVQRGYKLEKMVATLKTLRKGLPNA